MEHVRVFVLAFEGDEAADVVVLLVHDVERVGAVFARTKQNAECEVFLV